MKHCHALLILLLIISHILGAQELILEPSFIKTKPTSNINVKKSTSVNLVYPKDTLILPFIDDFSSDFLFPASTHVMDSNYTLVTQHHYVLMSTNKSLKENKLSFDTSFVTTINLLDTTIIARTAVDTVLIYDYKNYPYILLDSAAVWANYSLVDSLNEGSFDSLFVDTIANDSVEFGVVAPYKNLWLNNLVNLNSNYALNMPSIGVATFDAVDHYGFLYAQGSTAPFSADSLTSKFINLSNSSQVYLSFMIQPGGIGDEPESQDELQLMFKDSSGIWNQVWSSNEESELLNDNFSTVFIPVLGSNLLHSSFQFMFVNLASLSSVGDGWKGNADQWHLDYVVLDKNRSNEDDYIQDVSFSSIPASLINGYHSVPWNHYKNQTASTKTTSSAQVHNKTKSTVNNNYQTTISENNIPIFQDPTGSSANLSAGSKKDFVQNLGGFTFSSSEKSEVSFEVRHSLTHDITGDLVSSNDTVRVIQEFSQYYAYDDGSAEAGYGINSFNGQFAMKYEVWPTSEALTAIDVYFNNTLTQENFNIPIQLKIWSNNNGIPGEVLAETVSRFPLTSDSLNVFLSYKLPNPINVSGSVFVGWKQLSDNLLNIGLDRNTNSQEKMFYHINNVWKSSSIQGTVMIRPRFGTHSFLKTNDGSSKTVSFYPNPVSNQLRIKNYPSGAQVKVYNLYGQLVLTAFTHLIEMSHLTPSSYLVVIEQEDGKKIEFQKFIKL